MKLSKTELFLHLLKIALLLVFLVLSSSISHAASSEDTSTQEPTISVPVSSWNELNALKAINEKQGQELTKASNLLTTQEAKLNEASTSLEELTEQIKRNKRTEQRLKRQRDTWAVVSGVFGLAGAIRR